MISSINIWISFILPQCPLYTLLFWVVHCKEGLAWEYMNTNNLQNMVVQYVPIHGRNKNRALDRREIGTNTFPSVQIYQCHTPVKFSVDNIVSVS